MRPQPGELDLPSDLYRWRGVDGTEILALRIAVGLYHTERDNIERPAPGRGPSSRSQTEQGCPGLLGDRRSRRRARRARICIRSPSSGTARTVSDILHSTPEKLYARARAAAAAAAPLVEGDLQRCFTGTYTSHLPAEKPLPGEPRRAPSGRNAPHRHLVGGRAAVPGRAMAEAWRDHLFNDFHDILPGSCTQPAEQDALDQYGRVAGNGPPAPARRRCLVQPGGSPEPLYPASRVLNATLAHRRLPARMRLHGGSPPEVDGALAPPSLRR